jgi:hypothetical protein
METANPAMTPQLLQDALLLKRDTAIAKVNAVFDGQIQELCLRTRYPKEMNTFIAACLAQRGELEKGAGERCLFVRDRETWTKFCESSTGSILVAQPELDFESARNELLQPARVGHNAVIFALTNPRADMSEIVDLVEPSQHDVLELLKKHNYPPADAARIAKRSNGNIHLLTQLLSGTSERRKWATGSDGYNLRCLALIGGWNDGAERDQSALTELLGEPYEAWTQRLYPLTYEVEPPVLLEGKSFRPVSRYETWQQLGHYLTNADLERFRAAATKILSETEATLKLPKAERASAIFSDKQPTYSSALRKGIAETLALLGGQGKSLNCSPTLPAQTADQVIYSLLNEAEWQRWASLSDVMPLLAEASPSTFLEAVEAVLKDTPSSPLKEVFEADDDTIFSRHYHCGLLWALEVLAWNPDYLNRVCVCLTRLATYTLPRKMGNNPAATLRTIFLTWLPQTLANVDARRIAVEKVIEVNPEIGWNLLLSILPEAHQVGNHNQKPVWRDWIGSTWTEGVTRSEMNRQIRNYAELAVQCAVSDVNKITELIARWDHLPREIFQNVLAFLTSAKVTQRPEAERFILWQKLTDEVQRHRRFASSDWAMPAEEVKRLDDAARAIIPSKASIVHQRLFNYYEHEFFTSENYKEEEKTLARAREHAIAEVIAQDGLAQILEMAKAVKLPVELGQALGRIGNADLDAFLMPMYLENVDQPLLDLTRGYVWARYFKATFDWVEQLNISMWTLQQQIAYFAAMPFHAAVWRQAAKLLGGAVCEYWTRIWPNVFQANDDLPEAVTCALDNQRPDIAVAGINAMRHLKKTIPNELSIRALRQFAGNEDALLRMHHHELVETIKHLQESPDIDEEEMVWIEFQFLRLLDRFSGGVPIFLERKLASDPNFFHESIMICFRSEHERDQPNEIDPKKRKMAEHVFRLLHDWKTPPGATKHDTIDETALMNWIQEAKRLCLKSGHWAIAQQTIGHTFAFHPAGLEGMLKNPATAKVLDNAEFDDMRTGFRLALFNERGVHGFSHGMEELELAIKYRNYAVRYDSAKFTLVAAALRSLADSYERDAEQEGKRNTLQLD